MKVNLIIDGNYILNKIVYSLDKYNLLYGQLFLSLEKNTKNNMNLYSFENIYFVSDSRGTSWRKKLYSDYKNREKPESSIDWSFVYETYDNFKKSLPSRVKLFEKNSIEGDDWISFLVDDSNKKEISTIIITNDHDIKQKLNLSLNPLWINIMINEINNKEKIFLPLNWKLFLDSVSRIENDLFDLNNNSTFLKIFNRFVTNYDLIEVDSKKSLLLKLISGDKSDTIKSVWLTKTKNGEFRNIGIDGANKIIDIYTKEFGDISMDDPDMFENIADIICESKKISKTNIEKIVKNINFNYKLISLELSNLPSDIVNKMESKYNEYFRSI
jgi:hypothetical protein